MLGRSTRFQVSSPASRQARSSCTSLPPRWPCWRPHRRLRSRPGPGRLRFHGGPLVRLRDRRARLGGPPRIRGAQARNAQRSLGVAAFTGAAWLACLFRHTWPGRVALGVIIAVGLAAAADALRPGPAHVRGRGRNLAAAAAMVWTGYGLALVPVAAALGARHIWPGTCSRCTAARLRGPRRCGSIHLLPRPLRFTTGKLAERWIVSPLLLAALAFLVWHDTGVVHLAAHARPAIGAQ